MAVEKLTNTGVRGYAPQKKRYSVRNLTMKMVLKSIIEMKTTKKAEAMSKYAIIQSAFIYFIILTKYQFIIDF